MDMLGRAKRAGLTNQLQTCGALATYLGRLPEARPEAQAGLAMNPTFTIARLRASVPSDSPARITTLERVIDGLRKAGVPEE